MVQLIIHSSTKNMTSFSVKNPSIPCREPIPGGMITGRTLSFQGSLAPNCSILEIGLICGNQDGADQACHIIFRFEDLRVVLNHFADGKEGKEVSLKALPLKKGQAFEVLFICDDKSYKILLDGKHFCDFFHRIPFQRVTHVEVKGDVVIKFIIFGGTVSSQHSTEHVASYSYGPPPPQPYGYPPPNYPQQYPPHPYPPPYPPQPYAGPPPMYPMPPPNYKAPPTDKKKGGGGTGKALLGAGLGAAAGAAGGYAAGRYGDQITAEGKKFFGGTSSGEHNAEAEEDAENSEQYDDEDGGWNEDEENDDGDDGDDGDYDDDDEDEW